MEFEQVISVRNMRQSDAQTIKDNTSSKELMQRAAEGIFKAAKFVGKVCIVCGKGNNAGDGYALAAILCKNGFTPVIVRVSDKFSEDGLYYYNIAKKLGAQEMSLSEIGNFEGYDIVVDCLLGTGFKGTLSGDILTAVENINASNAFVISADINSGINGDTGVADIAVNSDLTVSIGYLKTGFFINDAPYYIDKLVNVSIGINLVEDEFKLIDYSNIHFFEGYNSEILSCEEFSSKYNVDRNNGNIVSTAISETINQKKTIVVKTEHSAMIADVKYVYFCADYVCGTFNM